MAETISGPTACRRYGRSCMFSIMMRVEAGVGQQPGLANGLVDDRRHRLRRKRRAGQRPDVDHADHGLAGSEQFLDLRGAVGHGQLLRCRRVKKASGFVHHDEIIVSV